MDIGQGPLFYITFEVAAGLMHGETPQALSRRRRIVCKQGDNRQEEQLLGH